MPWALNRDNTVPPFECYKPIPHEYSVGLSQEPTNFYPWIFHCFLCHLTLVKLALCKIKSSMQNNIGSFCFTHIGGGGQAGFYHGCAKMAKRTKHLGQQTLTDVALVKCSTSLSPSMSSLMTGQSSCPWLQSLILDDADKLRKWAFFFFLKILFNDDSLSNSTMA